MELIDRIKEVAKSKGKGMKDIAARLGITYPSLYNRLTGGVKLETMKEIAAFLDCEVQELLPVGEKYAHFYDKQEWLGIRRR